MGRIHRKNQIWLYQKFKQEQKEQRVQKICIKKTKEPIEEKVESNEKLYILLDAIKYIVPILIAAFGISLII